MDRYDLRDIIDEYIDPALLTYEEWLYVGMGLKEDGYTAQDWERWSAKDPKRYKAGECYRKWDTFNGVPTANVTAGTIVQMAKDRGFEPEKGTELDWDAEIGKEKDELVVVEKGWIEGQEVIEPKKWKPADELIKYLETLFSSDENVGYVTQSWEYEGKPMPKKGAYDRTAGELISALNKSKNDIGKVIGDYKETAGAWIRFNPLDGKGVKNENVTDFKYALVESDSMPVDEQNAIIRKLELPVACLVHSGGKSLHAIVKIEAKSYDEYRKRVDFLYTICQKNGLQVDAQNKNPSRLSRMPGVTRNDKKQFLVDTNIGKASWDEWKDWIESVNDDLPDPETLADTWDDLPELSAPLIDGVLRQGHKMLLAGPSKAGKSYALIQLCIAIAEGERWLQWECAQGKVMYVNLELDRASCLHRFRDVYEALHIKPKNLKNIEIWNLRGKSTPMDKLAPKLIRRAAKKDYIAIIIDPIYKVITGDENSADQMAHFCNQFDLVCHELGAAVIYCHHHSKGGQGQKRSMDRASGSGVFARDPDALLDLIELDVSEEMEKAKRDELVCGAYMDILDKYSTAWEDKMQQQDMRSPEALKKACQAFLSGEEAREVEPAVKIAERRAEALTAWRIEGTLREFPKFAPVNLWFDYPVHHIDRSEELKTLLPEGEVPPWKRKSTQKKTEEDKEKAKKEAVEMAYAACKIDGAVTVKAMSEYMSISEKTVRRKIVEHGGYEVKNGQVTEKK